MDYLSSAIVEKLSVVIKQCPSQLLGSYADLVRSHPDMVRVLIVVRANLTRVCRRR